ncbi:MAG: Tm-1-like ATP-binding domain-containing protein, partial [Planctomycetales bacterium]|nr:Tm-1-like ATP-binding domain-containing protein [Planctomycetales bacterium]
QQIGPAVHAEAQARRPWFGHGGMIGYVGVGHVGSPLGHVVTEAMRALPVGVPKVCMSTLAAGDIAPFVDVKDILMMPSVIDVSGVNRISRVLIAQLAGAICGMANVRVPPTDKERPIVAASMFGNTTQCVDTCRRLLEQAGYEVLVFHATGAGGRAMEMLVDEGRIDAVLDITTTEWADEVCGGILSAGPDRLSAPGRRGVPHLVVPGCIDMANFGPVDTVPRHFRDAGRQLYCWSPTVTLMRTNVEENKSLGRIFAEKLNVARGPRAVLLPMQGVSILDGEGMRFCDREADRAMFAALREHLDTEIPVREVDANINDKEFAEQAVGTLLEMIRTQERN